MLNKWQVRLGALALACWLVLLVILLTADKSLRLGSWAEPAHFYSSVFLAIAVAALLVARGVAATVARIGWLTLIVMVVVVVLLELLQQISATRTFQLQDIIDGVAGGATGAIISAGLFYGLGASRFCTLSIVQSMVVMLVVVVLSTLKPSPPPLAKTPAQECEVQAQFSIDWSLARIEHFRKTGDRIEASNAVFCEFIDGVNAMNGELILDGGALVSAPLTGLLEAAANSGQISFAVRFRSASTQRPKSPGLLAALIRSGKSSQLLARVVWHGKNLSTVIRLNRYEGTSTNIAKRVTNRYHEVAVVYDGEQQTTYFDGEVVGYERTLLDPPQQQDMLSLELGARSDGRWQPFEGVIQSIVISATALTAAEVAGLFSQLPQH